MTKNFFSVIFAISSFSLKLKMIIKQIIFIEEQIDHLDLELETLVRKIDSQIITIPGIVPTNAAAFSNYYSSLLDFL